MHRYFRCLLLEETVDVEVKVKTMRDIHTFRRDCTTQVISCKPWSPRLHPLPSLIKKMQTYLELDGKLGNQPCTSTYQLGNTTSLQKTPVPQKVANKKRRTKTPIKRQFKVRLVEKSLLVNPEPEVVATTATLTQTSVVKPTTTTAKHSLIPLMVYSLAQSKIQEIPNPTRKFQEEESPFTPNHGNTPVAQQQPKAKNIATSTAPLTIDNTPWANTIQALKYLFVARASWPIPPNVNEVPTPTFVKTEKADEKTSPKQAAIPHTLILNKPQNSKAAEEACGWGPQCAICTQSTPNIKAKDSEEDWNGDRERNRKEDQLERNYYPPSPQYSPSCDFPDRLSHHYKLEKDRNVRLEFLNEKFNLDYYSDSNSDSDFDHEYETLI